MNGGHFAQAAKLLFTPAIEGSHSRAAHKIMLSRCAIGLDRYEACQDILKIAFEGEDKAIIEELQGTFVYHKMGMQADGQVSER